MFLPFFYLAHTHFLPFQHSGFFRLNGPFIKGLKVISCAFYLLCSTPYSLTCQESDPFNIIDQLSFCDPVHDPLEGWNRALFSFNDKLDALIITPTLTGAFFFLPPSVRQGFTNASRNLNDFSSFFNHLFQKQSERAGHSLLRFIINSTLGVLGFFDVATRLGVKEDKTSFNHTLRTWGVNNGPYVVWPVLGPLTLRDFTGVFVDYFLDPYNITCIAKGWSTARKTKTWLGLAHEKEMLIPHMEDLKNQSLDFYSSVRSVYYQNRHCEREKDSGDGVSVW